MAIRVTSSVDKPRSGNWNDWVPPPCPDISDLDLWRSFKPGWLEDVLSRPVDAVRTAGLPAWDDVIRTNTTKGTVNGVHSWTPFQRMDTIPRRNAKIWMAKTPGSLFNWFPSITIPLPDYVAGRRETICRRFGDPTVTGSDAQAFYVDPVAKKYYELSAFGPSVFPYAWRADNVSVWDLSKDWKSQKEGITAAKIPMLPMLPTFEQYESGNIDHAIPFVANRYAPEVTGLARGTDGLYPDSPLRAGERLRLTEEAGVRLLGMNLSHHDVVLLKALRRHGMILTDRTGPDVPHSIRQAQDPRISVTLQIRLTDFEVLA